MNRNELLKRQQMRSAQRTGIPGWLWGLLVGGIAAFAAAGIVMRPSGESRATAPAQGGQSPIAQQQAWTRPAQAPVPQPREVTLSPGNNDYPEGSRVEDDRVARQAEEVDRLREEVEQLRRERTSDPPRANLPAPQATSDQKTNETQEADPRARMAEAEKEWRPVFAEYQKQYSTAKREHDSKVEMLKQYKVQCGYTQIGEPTEAQRRQGVRQEGLPANLIMGGTIEYAKLNCDSIDLDLRKAEQDRFDALRAIEKACYYDAAGRGVSTARARLR